jgi:hypothetical protein
LLHPQYSPNLVPGNFHLLCKFILDMYTWTFQQICTSFSFLIVTWCLSFVTFIFFLKMGCVGCSRKCGTMWKANYNRSCIK